MANDQVRRHRAAASHAAFRRASPGKTSHTSPKPAATLSAGVVYEMVRRWPKSLWQLPAVAKREGGLWLLSSEAIRMLPSDPPHGPFRHLYSTSAAAPASSAAWGTIGKLPAVECARPPGAPLPPQALQLVRAGMCCLLEHASLWPAAERSWHSAAYLRSGMRGAMCNVLSSPADGGRRFSYWFSHGDRVQAGYQAKPLVSTLSMTIDAYFDACSDAHRDRAAIKPHAAASPPVASERQCLYLQQTILQQTVLRPDGQGLMPCGGLVGAMAQDIEYGVDVAAIKALMDAGGFGSWTRSQLFVGSQTSGARSILHFDQYDNVFVQIAGTKRFRIFDPEQTPYLYAYPVHHPLDTRSQVDLEDPQVAETFPRLREARGTEIILHPGQTLFLPAYWWHEVTTLPAAKVANGVGHTAAQEPPLNVSVNFWFDVTPRLLSPTRPLVPSMRCELARQLEYLVSDCLLDRAKHVPTLFAGLLAALEAAAVASSTSDANKAEAAKVALPAARNALHAARPVDVMEAEWDGLFEFVTSKFAELAGGGSLLTFARELCHPSRFAHLRLEKSR